MIGKGFFRDDGTGDVWYCNKCDDFHIGCCPKIMAAKERFDEELEAEGQRRMRMRDSENNT